MGRAVRGAWSRGRAVVAAVLIVGTSLGCTSRERPAPTIDDVERPECTPMERVQHPLPVITTLVTRDHDVIVHASDDGLRFSVALADGVAVGRMLTAAEFEQRFPALHRRFDATFAGDEPWLDASLEGSAVGPREGGSR